ncbi:MAG: hypothetical protein OZ921_01020 [Sorangiineae bacterium]|nr:hypothetical protein [Polyangiaceae bacterium]MEB2321065.1 hypothetical protein [Sorangiineae bacterium]
MPRGVRSFWLPFAAVAYVGVAAASERGGWAPWTALFVASLGLLAVWRRTAEPPRGEDRVETTARLALRAAAWGAAVFLAARAGPAGRPALDAAANLGAGATTVAALVALARIGGPGGLLTPPPASRSLDAAAFSGLLWGIAVALPAASALSPSAGARVDPLAIDYATTTAGAAGLFVMMAAAWRLRHLRRLELGVGDRAAGALALAITALLVAVPAALLDVAAPDRILPAAGIVASLACTWAATTREPTTVSAALRGILAIMMLGAPVVLLGGVVAVKAPAYAGPVVLATTSLSVVVGLIARAVARPLGPEQSRWLDAIDAASRGALQPEPDAALRAALGALSEATSAPGARPELWRSDPEEVLSVDVAGYLHVEKTAAPARVYELALAEPERTLRAEALTLLEVRRADVRPLLAWFDARRAFSATLIVDDDGPLGFIMLPRGSRTAPMTLEEARAVRVLADRMSSLFAVSSALARSRERELIATARAEEMNTERRRLEHIIELGAGRNALVSERLASRVRQAAYSPAARLAVDQVEELGKSRAMLGLIAPLGVDAAGWAALAHAASPRRGGPLVIVEGTSGAEHDLTRWQDPESSPLALADGGTLVVLDAGALPLEVQELIVATLGRGAAAPSRSTVPPAGLIVSSPEPLDASSVSTTLARCVGDALVRLPSLAERGDDLSALVLAELTRASAGRGAPLGLEPAALRQLVEHEWLGNDAELRAVMVRAAAVTPGSRLTLEALRASGFAQAAPAASAALESSGAPPPVQRRRPRAPGVRRY